MHQGAKHDTKAIVIKEKWDAILTEVKNKSGTPPAIAESYNDYYSVIRRTLKLKVGTDDAPNVEKVLINDFITQRSLFFHQEEEWS